MEDSKSQGHHEEITDNKLNKETLEIKNKEPESISSSELNKNKDLKINPTENIIDKGNNLTVKDKLLEDNDIEKINSSSNTNIDKNKNNTDKNSNEIIKENKSEDNKSTISELKSDTAIKKSAENIDNTIKEISKEKINEDNKSTISEPKSDAASNKSAENIDNTIKEISKEKINEDNKSTISEPRSDTSSNKSPENNDKANKEISKKNNLEENKKDLLTAKNKAKTVSNIPKEISTNVPVKAKTKPVKEPPIEKKPFLEFVNDFLIPEIKNEFKSRGKEVNKINLQKTHRPIAEDICWVIYCEINDTCNFWLSFEKDDITSLKSFSLCKNYEKPSIIESFLIDEKKITLKLIISRILQRLNGQKLIGAN